MSSSINLEASVSTDLAARRCTYFGSAAVPWDDYLTSVVKQAARKVKLGIPDLCKVFSDVMLSPAMITQIGQAVYAGKALFLYGPPGNGKTSIAERIVRAVSESIWIPRTITITSEIIRLFDPACHELADDNVEVLADLSYDMRWLRIKRPSLIVGGELTLDQFEAKVVGQHDGSDLASPGSWATNPFRLATRRGCRVLSVGWLQRRTVRVPMGGARRRHFAAAA